MANSFDMDKKLLGKTLLLSPAQILAARPMDEILLPQLADFARRLKVGKSAMTEITTTAKTVKKTSLFFIVSFSLPQSSRAIFRGAL